MSGGRMAHRGRIAEWCPDFAGWHYAVQTDPPGVPIRISDGSVLVLAHPDTGARPLSARLLFVPPGWLEEAVQ